MEPYLVIGQELAAVSEYTLSRLTRKTAFRIAKETFMYLHKLDGEEHLAWYEAGVLTEVDQFQDRHIRDRLLKGLHILSERYPMTVKRAQRRAERVAQRSREGRKR